MILKNQYIEEIKNIFQESDKNYINQESNDIATSDKKITNYVYYEEAIQKVVGYVSVYEGTDFWKKEGFETEIEELKEDTVYIWEIGTRKGYEKRGIASAMLKYVVEKYHTSDIYSCVESSNIASRRIHEKMGFKVVSTFEDNFFGREKEIYMLLKVTRH